MYFLSFNFSFYTSTISWFANDPERNTIFLKIWGQSIYIIFILHAFCIFGFHLGKVSRVVLRRTQRSLQQFSVRTESRIALKDSQKTKAQTGTSLCKAWTLMLWSWYSLCTFKKRNLLVENLIFFLS